MRPMPSFFEGVSAQSLEVALGQVERRHLAAGSVILAEGDARGEMYVLTAGSAEVVLVDRAGVEHVVSSVRRGETIGEMSLLTDNPASATVRAVEEVELLVLREADLDRLAEEMPELQRNLIGALAARLTRVTRLAVHEQPGHVLVLENNGGPDLLGYLLSASVAWHTRGRTVHVVFGGNRSPALVQLATLTPERPFGPRRTAGADLMLADLEGHFGPASVEEALEELARRFDYVLLEVPARVPAELGERRVRLGSFGSREGGFAIEGSDGSGAGAPAVRVPELTRDDTAALEQGLLPPTTPAGAVVGRVARELAGLRVGVALGAGSMRGYAHIGVLRALARRGIPIDVLAGTSIGALVGVLYARFGDLEQVVEFLDGVGGRMFRPTLSRKSLLSTGAMRRYTRKVVGDPLLEDLSIPIGLVATDVDTQDEVVLRRGSSVAATFASAAVPGVFPAVRIGNRTLVDGGVVNPVPVSVAAGMGADVVIGVQLVHGGGVQTDELSEEGEGPVPSAVAAIMRSIELLQTRITTDASSVKTILVTPEFDSLPAGKLRNFREGRRYIDAGEMAVELAHAQLQAALPWLRPTENAADRDTPGGEGSLPSAARTGVLPAPSR